LVAGFIAILRAVADVLKWYKKKDEAAALEKAAKAIESTREISLDQAKETLAGTLGSELGADKARPLVEYTEMLETLLPFRPFGKLLQYGLAIEELVLQIQDALSRLQVFERYGAEVGDNVLVFDELGSAFEQVFMADYIVAFLLPPVRGKRRERSLASSLLVMYSTRFGHVSVDRSKPFSLVMKFETRSDKKERKLDAKKFGLCVEALLRDTTNYLDMLEKELEASGKHERKRTQLMDALKLLSTPQLAESP
jgi:hypothetical protein